MIYQKSFEKRQPSIHGEPLTSITMKLNFIWISFIRFSLPSMINDCFRTWWSFWLFCCSDQVHKIAASSCSSPPSQYSRYYLNYLSIARIDEWYHIHSRSDRITFAISMICFEQNTITIKNNKKLGNHNHIMVGWCVRDTVKEKMNK